MSIQWMDNFGSYGMGSASVPFLLSGTPYTVLNYLFGAGEGVMADPVISGGVCLNVGQNNSNYPGSDNRIALPVPANAIGTAFRYYADGGNQRTPIYWEDSGGNGLYGLVVELNGALSLYTMGGLYFLGTQVATTTIPVITFSTWWHIEAMLDYVLGKITVFVEGVQVLSYSFTPDSGTLIYNMGFTPRTGLGTPGGVVAMKDFVLYDKTGSNNNSAGAIGPCSVYRLTLDSDFGNGWTITGGSTVNGTIGGEPPNDSTQYISAGVDPIPTPALCGITPLPSNIVGVRGIMSLQRVQKSDGGDAEYTSEFISSGSTHAGTAHTMSTSFNYQWDVLELDPATGELFSPVAVNNLTVGLNRTV